jgi:hypothetical protein
MATPHRRKPYKVLDANTGRVRHKAVSLDAAFAWTRRQKDHKDLVIPIDDPELANRFIASRMPYKVFDDYGNFRGAANTLAEAQDWVRAQPDRDDLFIPIRATDARLVEDEQ